MVVEQPFALPTGWAMKANATIGDSRPTRIRTDAEGHAIVPDALPQPRFTLAVLGGSTMFGVGVADNADNVPSQLQTVLRREYGIEVNVINLAARGYVSLQELLVLNHYLAEHPVDMVVSVSGHNDLMRYIGGERHSAYVASAGNSAVALVRQVEAGNFVVSNFIPALRRLSQTANLAVLAIERRQDAIKQKRKAANVGTKPPTEAAKPQEASRVEAVSGQGTPKEAPTKSTPSFLDAHLGHYAMMNAVCEAHHTCFRLFFQPNVFTKAHLTEKERNHLLQKDFAGSQDKFDACALAHRNYRAAFGTVPKTFPYIDLAAGFGEATTDVYVDSCHFNELGANLLARVLAADLAPVIQARLAAQL